MCKYMKSKIYIIIIGSTVTALSVIRSAIRNKYNVFLIDNVKGIAFYSKYINEKNSVVVKDSCTDFVIKFSKKTNNNYYLIATSDNSLNEIILNRYAIEKSGIDIIHPENIILNTCLNKNKFYQWCCENNFNHPLVYNDIIKNNIHDSNIKYPLLVRVAEKTIDNLKLNFPKVVIVDNAFSLEKIISYCQVNNIECIISESLLGQQLIQYSVPVAIAGKRITSFVAKKVRPFPEQCAVGSYVELSVNKKIEEIAVDLLVRMNFQGIAEVEILFSITKNVPYIIEVNPRPWTQYSLAVKSHHNFLKFIIDTDNYKYNTEIKSGMAWIDINMDLFFCFSRSVGLIKKDKIKLIDYIKSMMHVRTFSDFDIFDLKPLLFRNFKFLFKYK